MRFLTILMISAGVAAGQSQDSETNMSCVERLEIPEYPPLAKQARISGSVTTTVAVSVDGSIQIMMSRGAHPLLKPAVEYALRKSSFHKSCGGKSVVLVFNFVLGEERVSYGYPNQFWIFAPPTIAQP